MSWLRAHWNLFSALVLIFGAGWVIFSPPAESAARSGKISAPREGFLAPDFTLRTAEDESVRLSDLRGTVVLVNLWASWCPPCKAEMPAMQAVYEQYGPGGFTILAVNTTYQDDPTAAREFVASRALTFPVLFDEDGAVSRKYMVRSMPTSFFVDAQGVIRRVVIGGPMSEALLRAEIERLLEEKP